MEKNNMKPIPVAHTVLFERHAIIAGWASLSRETRILLPCR
jgi:hypothetical protein